MFKIRALRQNDNTCKIGLTHNHQFFSGYANTNAKFFLFIIFKKAFGMEQIYYMKAKKVYSKKDAEVDPAFFIDFKSNYIFIIVLFTLFQRKDYGFFFLIVE